MNNKQFALRLWLCVMAMLLVSGAAPETVVRDGPPECKGLTAADIRAYYANRAQDAPVDQKLSLCRMTCEFIVGRKLDQMTDAELQGCIDGPAAPTPTPKAGGAATPTPAPAGSYTVQGKITDGHGAALPFVYVRLTYGTNEKVSATDAAGQYKFTDLPNSVVAGFNPAEDAYRVEVRLQYMAGNPRFMFFQERYGDEKGPVVTAITKAFALPAQPAVVTSDIDFGNAALFQQNILEKIDTQLPARLDDLAAIYVHTSQAVKTAATLGQQLDLPFDVVAYTKGQSDACWHGQESDGGQWNQCLNFQLHVPQIGLGENFSDFSTWSRPMNREWHEFGHHFLANSFGNQMPSFPGRANHQGYCVNPQSTDAWTEGFAEFYAMLTAKYVAGDKLYTMYRFGTSNVIDLEWNYKARNGPYEELAVASLLVDLVDGKDDAWHSGTDDDSISVSPEEVWTAIQGWSSSDPNGNGYVFDVVDLYGALEASGIGIEDTNGNGLSDLDEVFIAHGFFEDLDGDQRYDSGEQVAYTSHLAYTVGTGGTQCAAMNPRRDVPDMPGGFVAFTAVAGTGFAVEIQFDPPNDYLNMTYTVPPEAVAGGRLYLMLPPETYVARAHIVAQADGYQSADALVIDNTKYWAAVPGEPDTPLLTHTFALERKTTPAPDLGTVLPVAAGALCLCGLGGVVVIGLTLLVNRPGQRPPAHPPMAYPPQMPSPPAPPMPYPVARQMPPPVMPIYAPPAAPPSATFRLVMAQGPQPGRTFDLSGAALRIGREVFNEILIDDAEISRGHARLVWQGGGYVLQDLRSRNGLFVNGQRVLGSRPLAVGDQIQLGHNVVLMYQPAGAAETSVSMPPVGYLTAPLPPGAPASWLSIPCPRCGYVNAPGSYVCQRCGGRW